MEKADEMLGNRQGKRIVKSLLQEIEMLDGLAEKSPSDIMIEYIINAHEKQKWFYIIRFAIFVRNSSSVNGT